MSTTAETVHLYGMHTSTGCRLVQWVANICGVAFEFHTVDLGKGDHLKPGYVHQTRERHCIPSMIHEVNGDRLCITESRAIARYLIRIGNGNICEVYNYMGAAEIDELVDYEATCLYKRVSKCAYARLFSVGQFPTEKDFEALNESLQYIETRLGSSMHLNGGTLTLPDVLFANTLSMLVVVPEIDIYKYPAVKRWLGCLYQYGNYDEVTREFYKYSESITRAEDLGSCSSSSDADDTVSLMSDLSIFESASKLTPSMMSGSDGSEFGFSGNSVNDPPYSDTQSVVSVLSEVDNDTPKFGDDESGDDESGDDESGDDESGDDESGDDESGGEGPASTTSDGYVLTVLADNIDNSTDATDLIPCACCSEFPLPEF